MLPLFKVLMSDSASSNVSSVLNSGYIGQGPKVEEFELLLKKHFNHQYLSTVNSGTAALHLATHILDLGPDDEVLTTPLTCTATNWAILANKVDIRWIDIDQDTANVDLVDLERKLSNKTKAIMVVHWGGYPVDLDKLDAVVERHYLRFGFRPAIIEDCAHAFGSYYKGKHVGTRNLGAFSFQAIKHLTCGDGGVLLTPTEELNNRVKLLRWYGIDRNENGRKDFRCEKDIEEFGYKFHMNDINATIGLSNYDSAVDAVKKHIDNAKFYRNELKNVPGIELLKEEDHSNSSYWIFTVKAQNRDGLIKKLGEHEIMASRVHERNDKHSCVSKYKTALPALDQFVNTMICIPVGWWVNNDDRQKVVDVIKSGW